MARTRNKDIKIRFTEEEFFQIQNSFERSIFKTRVEFIRSLIFQNIKNDVAYLSVKELLTATEKKENEDLKNINNNRLLNELSRIGNNLNQLTRAVNSGKIPQDFKIEIIKMQIEFLKLKEKLNKKE